MWIPDNSDLVVDYTDFDYPVLDTDACRSDCATQLDTVCCLLQLKTKKQLSIWTKGRGRVNMAKQSVCIVDSGAVKEIARE